MADENFEPPRAPLQDPQSPRKTRSNLLAILLGAATDYTVTGISASLLTIGFIVANGAGGTNPSELQRALTDSTPLMIMGTALGMACSVLGGYVTARFANQNEYANALACDFIGVITGELSFSGDTSMWMHLLGFCTIPACLLGAHLKLRRDKPA